MTGVARDDTNPAAHGRRYLILAASTLALALAGYIGYVLFPRFDLPSLTGATLLILALAGGVASFFSPCSFPLLLTMLSRPIADELEAGGRRRATRRAATFAGALSIGAATFLIATGVLIALGAGTFFEDVTFTSTAGRIIRAVVGVLLILLGLIQLNVLPNSFRRFEPAMHGFLRRQSRLRRKHPVRGFALFGFGYVAAGFG